MPPWLTELETEISRGPQPARISEQPIEIEREPVARFEEGELPVEAEIEADEVTEIAPPEMQTPAEAAEPIELEKAATETTEAPPSVEEEQPIGAESPEWLSDLEQETVSEVTVEEMPDWLEQLRSDQETEPGTVEMPDQAAETSMPDQDIEWIREAQAFEEPEVIEAEEEITSPSAVIEGYGDRLGMDEQPLEIARAYLQRGELEAAAQIYESLVTMAESHKDIIADLEQAVDAHPEYSVLYRLLGDAYMQSGELQKALQTYQDALTKL
jgi:tetratricopeptide (TPR) repeat protein